MSISVTVIVVLLLVATALAAILIPLLKKPKRASGEESSSLSLHVLRDQLDELERQRSAGTLSADEYKNERADIERRAIEDGHPGTPSAVASRHPAWLAAVIGVTLIGLAIGLYLLLGTPTALNSASSPTGQQQNAHPVTPRQIQEMIEKLAERLQENPADGEGWLMLARAYSAQGRFPEASAAFGRATGLLPEDAQRLADYADTLAMAQGRRLAGDPEKLIRRARAIDPRNLKALALSGSVAFEREDYVVAIDEWRKALAVVPTESDVAARLRSSIADAEARSGRDSTQADMALPNTDVISGIVSLDASLRRQVANTDTVYVFARAATGPRMPLAIKRLTAGELPARFSLDNSMGMAGGPRLSDHKMVVVGARVSRSGDATPRSGDLEGFVEPTAIGSTNVQVTISKTVP